MKKLTLLLILVLGLSLANLHAQEAPLILTRGTPVTNTLDATTVARVYFFVAVIDETVTLTASGDGALSVGLLLSAPDGTILAQGVEDVTSGTVTLSNVKLPTTANFLVTVFATGVETSGTFTLNLNDSAVTPEVTESPSAVTPQPTAQFGVAPTPQGQVTASIPGGFMPPTQILLANGIQVSLGWNANVDMNLEVRDPLGNSLYFDSRTSPIGGEFGFDANGFCQVITPNPLETASWKPGFLPTGNYEILVYYRQACDAPDAVQFTLSVTANGKSVEPVQATLNPPLPNQNSVYVTSFRVNDDTSVVMNAGGNYPDSSLNVIPTSIDNIRANAQPIVPDVPMSGAIFGANFYRAYQFDAQANDLITTSVTTVEGNLDTLLQVVDANGNLIAVNDDANGTRNSQIVNLRLANAGTYFLVVTRYAKDLGGSEGNYQIALAGGVAQLPAEVLSLNLAPGDIQVALTWATSADLQLLVRDPIGDSVFDDTPAIGSGGTLVLNGNVNCVRATGNPASYINWQPGFLRPGNYEVDIWYQNDCADTTPVEFTLTVVVKGQIVTVERQRIQLNQHFVLSFTVNPDGTAVARLGGYATNDSNTLQLKAEVPTPIQPNQAVIGEISDQNTFDSYSFDGKAGQRVIIVAASTSPTLDTKLFLLSAGGLQVAENDDSGASSPTSRRSDAVIANYVLPEDGTYTIVVSRYATIYGGTIGGYSLTLTLN